MKEWLVCLANALLGGMIVLASYAFMLCNFCIRFQTGEEMSSDYSLGVSLKSEARSQREHQRQHTTTTHVTDARDKVCSRHPEVGPQSMDKRLTSHFTLLSPPT